MQGRSKLKKVFFSKALPTHRKQLRVAQIDSQSKSVINQSDHYEAYLDNDAI